MTVGGGFSTDVETVHATKYSANNDNNLERVCGTLA
jgi:hypothetical protein